MKNSDVRFCRCPAPPDRITMSWLECLCRDHRMLYDYLTKQVDA